MSETRLCRAHTAYWILRRVMTINLEITKIYVFDDVRMYSSYSGAKNSDEEAYERIRAVDDDDYLLQRFWTEACNGATERLKPFLRSVSAQPTQSARQRIDMTQDYKVTLEVSSSYDATLTESVQTSLHSYFVNYMVSRWYKFTNKEETENYGNDAVAAMDDVMRKIYNKKKPVRIVV